MASDYVIAGSAFLIAVGLAIVVYILVDEFL